MISSKLYAWFFILSCSIVFMLAIWVFREHGQEWRRFQPEFKKQAQAKVRKALKTIQDDLKNATDKSKREQLNKIKKNLEIRLDLLDARKTEIDQIVIPDLKRVDRCTTCHVGVKTPDYDITTPTLAGHPEPYLYELAELPGGLLSLSRNVHEPTDFGCTICHGGQGRAIIKDDAHGEVAHWNAPLLRGQYSESACGKCHFEESVTGASNFTAGRKLFLRAGCFGCHKIEKYPKDRIIAPTLKYIASKVKKEWLVSWLRNPKDYLPDTLMPNFGFPLPAISSHAANNSGNKTQTSEDESAAHSANIAHAEVIDQNVPANELGNLIAYLMTLTKKDNYPKFDESKLSDKVLIEQGEALVKESACSTCHDIAGEAPAERVAPSLTRIAQKANLAWIADWLRNPKKHLPSTKMPRYHFKDSEVTAVVAYLKKLSDSAASLRMEISVDQLQGNAKEGKKVIEKYGCFGCHEIPGFEGKKGIGPEISYIGSRGGYELDFGKLEYIGDLLSQGEKESKAAKNRLKAIQKELNSIEKNIGETNDALALRKLGERRQQKLAEKLGTENKIQELTNKIEKYKRIKDRIAGMMKGQSSEDIIRQRLLKDWLFIKVAAPRVFDPDQLKMPNFYFTPQQANNIVTFLLSLTKDVIPERLLVKPTPSLYKPTGKFGRLVAELNCFTCHKIYGRGGRIGPNLTSEGSRVKRDWLLNFFKNPTKIRPILRGRMPKFRLSDDDANALVEYIKLVLVDDAIAPPPKDIKPDISFGSDLYGQREGFACNACHKINGEGGNVGPNLTHAGSRLELPWVLSWLKNPQRLIPDAMMPNFGLEDEDAVHLSAYVLSERK